uniref:Uncharacterized protein n=1 Tax=Hubei reo-like virus 6 TaxID=1923181 RepID=A0A1L3KP82_9VIRU|nr:hypothetical protein 1 [Hubei reo-like virus 6]
MDNRKLLALILANTQSATETNNNNEPTDLTELIKLIDDLTHTFGDILIDLYGTADPNKIKNEVKALMRKQRTINRFKNQIKDLNNKIPFSLKFVGCSLDSINTFNSNITPRGLEFCNSGLKGFRIDISSFLNDLPRNEESEKLIIFEMHLLAHYLEMISICQNNADLINKLTEYAKDTKVQSKFYLERANNVLNSIFDGINALIISNTDKIDTTRNNFQETLADYVNVVFSLIETKLGLAGIEYEFSIRIVKDFNSITPETSIVLDKFLIQIPENTHGYLTIMLENVWEYTDITDTILESLQQMDKFSAPIKLNGFNSRITSQGYFVYLSTGKLIEVSTNPTYSHDLTLGTTTLRNLIINTNGDEKFKNVTGIAPYLIVNESELEKMIPITFYHSYDTPSSYLVTPGMADIDKGIKILESRASNHLSTIELSSNFSFLLRSISILEELHDIDSSNLAQSQYSGYVPFALEGLTSVVKAISDVLDSAVLYQNVHIEYKGPVQYSYVHMKLIDIYGILSQSRDRPHSFETEFKTLNWYFTNVGSHGKEALDVEDIIAAKQMPLIHKPYTHKLFENNEVMIIIEMKTKPANYKISTIQDSRLDPCYALDVGFLEDVSLLKDKVVPVQYGIIDVIASDEVMDIYKLDLNTPAEIIDARVFVLAKTSLARVDPTPFKVSTLKFSFFNMHMPSGTNLELTDWKSAEYINESGEKYFGIMAPFDIKITELPITTSSAPVIVKSVINDMRTISYPFVPKKDSPSAPGWVSNPGNVDYQLSNDHGDVATLSMQIRIAGQVQPKKMYSNRCTIKTGLNFENTDWFDSPFCGYGCTRMPNGLPDEWKEFMKNDYQTPRELLIPRSLAGWKGIATYVPNCLINGMCFKLHEIDIHINVTKSYDGDGPIIAFSNQLEYQAFAIELNSSNIRAIKHDIKNLEARISTLEKAAEIEMWVGLATLGLQILDVTGVASKLISVFSKVFSFSYKKLIRIGYRIILSSYGDAFWKFLVTSRFLKLKTSSLYEDTISGLVNVRLILKMLKKDPNYDVIKSKKKYDDLYKENESWRYLDPSEYVKSNLDFNSSFKAGVKLVDDIPYSRVADPRLLNNLNLMSDDTSAGIMRLYVRGLNCIPADVNKWIERIVNRSLSNASRDRVFKWMENERHLLHAYTVIESIERVNGKLVRRYNITGVGEANVNGIRGSDFNANVTGFHLDFKILGIDEAGRLIDMPLKYSESGMTKEAVWGIHYSMFNKHCPDDINIGLANIYNEFSRRMISDQTVTSVGLSPLAMNMTKIIVQDICDASWGYRLGLNIFKPPKNCQTYSFQLMRFASGGEIPSFVSDTTKAKLFAESIKYIDKNVDWTSKAARNIYVKRKLARRDRHKREIEDVRETNEDAKILIPTSELSVYKVKDGYMMLRTPILSGNNEKITRQYSNSFVSKLQNIDSALGNIRSAMTKGDNLLEQQLYSDVQTQQHEVELWLRDSLDEMMMMDDPIRREKFFNDILTTFYFNYPVRFNENTEIEDLIARMRRCL